MKAKNQVVEAKNWKNFLFLWLSKIPHSNLFINLDDEIFPLLTARFISSLKSHRILLIFANSAIAENQFKTLQTFKNYFPEMRDDLYFLPEMAFSTKQPSADMLNRFSKSIDAVATNSPGVFFSSAASLMTGIPELSKISRNIILNKSELMSPENLCARLVQMNYADEYEVSIPGEFSRRGGILDIFSPGEDMPVRIEFFGDRIESIRFFEPESQRSIKETDAYKISPVIDFENTNETVPLHQFFTQNKSTNIIFNPALCQNQIERFLSSNETEAWKIFLAQNKELICCFDTVESANAISGVDCSSLAFHPFDRLTNIHSKEEIQKKVLDEICRIKENGYEVVVAVRDSDGTRHVKELLKKYECQCNINVEQIFIPSSFKIDEAGVVFISEEDFFAVQVKRQYEFAAEKHFTKKKFSIESGEFFSNFEEGDYVVHNDYGIGIFKGFIDHEFNGVQSETMQIEFADEVMIYTDMHKAQLVSRYSGTGKIQPQLSKIGRKNWFNTKRSARQGAVNFASELLKIQAMRMNKSGFKFTGNHLEEKAFAKKFPFTETHDQLEAIQETFSDMSSPYPMDRLICGDAGYGKTEVAIRAAFRAVISGKQVALLVPTTILAQQHYYTFTERFSEYPFQIEMLSRFKTRSEQNEIVKKVAEGKVDILIGTHRILQNDIQFPDLGLLIIDEEQRFGVEHKEKLKGLRAEIDVISMSATPIPRTLYMALTGIRDVSIISTPPSARQSILSYISRYNEKIIADAINFELERGGQVFYIHNRVKTINDTAEKIAKIAASGAKIGIAHGQMDEAELEEVMLAFLENKIQILCCTTIIESGIDVPNANTIIIERADRFGLAELYQLRGRVGRGTKQAYAYFLLPEEAIMTTAARDRIAAVKRYSELGAGFRIAMRDLEIRGSGNLIGTEQSGYINAIGFELYCHFLKMASAELRGEKILNMDEAQVNLDFIVFGKALIKKDGIIEAYIPKKYIEAEQLRYKFYRKISLADNEIKLKEISDEMSDRFGKVPEPVKNLILHQKLKQQLLISGYDKLTAKGSWLEIFDSKKNRYLLLNGAAPKLKSEKPKEKIHEIIRILNTKQV